MYVCVCRAVTEKHIESAVHAGARHLRDLRTQLGITEECGRCAKCAKQCLEKAVNQSCEAMAPPPPAGKVHHTLMLIREAA